VLRFVFLVATVALVGAGASAPPSNGARICPRALLPLPANPVAPASRAALAREDAKGRPQVVGAVIASREPSARGAQVRVCGARVAERTVIVYVVRRAYLPAQSASQGVHFVGRTRNGYRVWQVAH
jgi:hypothetical protein